MSSSVTVPTSTSIAPSLTEWDRQTTVEEEQLQQIDDRALIWTVETGPTATKVLASTQSYYYGQLILGSLATLTILSLISVFLPFFIFNWIFSVKFSIFMLIGFSGLTFEVYISKITNKR